MKGVKTMKIIKVDNYDRELYDDKLIADNVTNVYYGKLITNLLNENPRRSDEDYFRLVEDDYKLFERDY